MTSRSSTRSAGAVLISGLTVSSPTVPTRRSARWRSSRWRSAACRSATWGWASGVSATSPSVTRPAAGPEVVVRSAMSTLPREKDDEHDGADDPEDQGDRHLEGHDDGAADEVADGDDRDAQQAHPGQVRAQVVTSHHGDHVGHDEPQER